MKKENIVIFSASLIIVILWVFPHFWYTKVDAIEGPGWLEEKTSIPGWSYEEKPVSESAERALVADTVFSGLYTETSTGRSVLAFSARRMKEDMNEIGLFVHTPDRCWTESGWVIEPNSEDLESVKLGNHDIQFERRIFNFKGRKELVYFCGLVGGQTLPYRLDHNLSVAMKYQMKQDNKDVTGTTARGSDSRFWARIWESFLSRRKITGPKQFVRVSVTVYGDSTDEDEFLQGFLKSWLN